MTDASERLKGAEALMVALYESATTDGYSFGRVCHRFCELAGLDMKEHPVRGTLHYAGGLTLNNLICGELHDGGADGGGDAGRGVPVGADALPTGGLVVVGDEERGLRRADAHAVGRGGGGGGVEADGLLPRIGGGVMMGQNLGGAERSREEVLQAEVRRLQSQLHDVAVEVKKSLNAVRYGGRDKCEEIDGHLCRALRVIEGGAT